MITKKDLKNYLQMDAKLTRLEEKLTEINTVELQEIYNQQWDALIDERVRIETAIAKLSDPVECAILGYKYIDGLTWEQLCVKINYSWRQIHRIHASALKNIERIEKSSAD